VFEAAHSRPQGYASKLYIRKNTLSSRQPESIQSSLGYSGYSNYSGYSGCPGLSKFLGQICEKSLVIPRLSSG